MPPPTLRLPLHRGRPDPGARRRGRILLLVLALIAGTAAALLPAPQARAALPDAWAYGWHDSADPPVGLLHDSTTSASTVGQVAAFTIPNHYLVRFPGAGKPFGVVHVTAVSKPVNVPSYCSPDKWYVAGPDEMVAVSCFVVSGSASVPFQTGFSVTFSSSTPPVAAGSDYAYVHHNGAATIITQFNQSGGAMTVNHLGTGLFQVKLPGVGVSGTPQGGSFQATGLTLPSGAPARCKVSDWTTFPLAQVINVRCFDGSGTPVDTQWTLSYQHIRDITGRSTPYFGHLWRTTAPPVATNFNSMLGFGANVSVPVGPASIQVKYPSIAIPTPSTSQITAYGTVGEFCRLSDVATPPWSAVGTTELIWSVDCFKANGSAIYSDFISTWAGK